MMYNKVVQDCFFLPKHVGVLDLTASFTVHFGSSQINQSMTKIELYLQCTESALVYKACFKAIGNPYVIASLEWLCRQIEGRELSQLPAINYQILVKELDIPTHQYPIALQVEDVYKEVLILMKKKFEGSKS